MYKYTKPLGTVLGCGLFVLTAPASAADLSDPSQCLASAPAELECPNTPLICAELGAAIINQLLVEFDFGQGLADRLDAASVGHPRCDEGGSHRQYIDSVVRNLDFARDEIELARAKALLGNPPPSYAAAGHIEGNSRRALSRLATVTYQASLAAVHCRDSVYRSDEAIAMF